MIEIVDKTIHAVNDGLLYNYVEFMDKNLRPRYVHQNYLRRLFFFQSKKETKRSSVIFITALFSILGSIHFNIKLEEIE
jgi:hypothetical protein